MKQLEEPDGCDCSATLRLTHGRGLMAWVNARVVFTYGLLFRVWCSFLRKSV